jgi:hypothetical protein
LLNLNEKLVLAFCLCYSYCSTFEVLPVSSLSLTFFFSLLPDQLSGAVALSSWRVNVRMFVFLMISSRHSSLTWLGFSFSLFFLCAISVTASCLRLVSSPADRAPRGFIPGHEAPLVFRFLPICSAVQAPLAGFRPFSSREQ